MGLKCISGQHQITWSCFGDPGYQGGGFEFFSSALYNTSK